MNLTSNVTNKIISMEQETIMQSPVQEQPVVYGGFWRRFLAVIIDGLVVSFAQQVIFVPLLILLGVGFVSSGGDPGEILDSDVDIFALGAFVMAYMGMALFSIVVNWLYYALMESSKYQGTIGKIALNMKVTDYQGERISFLKATGRYFSKILSGLIFMIGYIMAGFTSKKQALHDMIAETYVVRK